MALFEQLAGTLDWVTGGALVVIVVLWGLLLRLPGDTTLRFPAFALFGTLAALLALVGVDSLWAQSPIPRITAIGLSVVVGFALFWVLSWIAISPPFRREDSYPGSGWPTIASATAFAVLFALVLPAGFAASDWLKGEKSGVPAPHALPSTLDVIVLRDDDATPPPASQSIDDWTVHTFAGRVPHDGDDIIWDNGAPPRADDAGRTTRVLLLFPDGGDTNALAPLKRRPEVTQEDPGGIARWMRVARTATDAPVPTYAFLRSSDQDRLDAWGRELRHTGDASVPHGDAVGLDAIGSAETTTDLALRYGVQHPSASQDLALAVAHRPVLLFDSGERLARPLDLTAVVASGALRQCPRGQLNRDRCPAIHRSDDLKNNKGVLAFDPAEVAAASKKSIIYAHVTHTGNDAPDAIYLDYWWYLPDNPTGAVGGALCGAGFTLAGRTCHDHQSDWEGMTVVLDAADPDGPPLKVIYAQHDGASSYSWEAAQHQWGNEHGVDLTGVHAAVRPLAFVAKGTHAAYALSCDARHCTETGARDLKPSKGSFAENGHDGGTPWREGNADQRCNGQCVQLLPTNGDEPALWNAFDGNWGSQSCVLRTICTKSEAPRSPAYQARYQEPWCADRLFTLNGAGHTVVAAQGSCPELRATAQELASTDTLLALGDSFSSGQGAGEYQRGTDKSGRNTCYRSRGAWPNILAERLHLHALQSLACSGAVSAEVRFDDRAHVREAERTDSQVGRIKGHPQIITLTIGGNDVGFSKILITCMAIDCYRHYHRADGDTLEQKVRDVQPDLLATYTAIRDKAPDSRLVVLGYPRLFPRRLPDRQPVGRCIGLSGITGIEATYLNKMLAQLNAAIAASAVQAGATYVNAEEALNGHEEGCDVAAAWLNPPDARDNPRPASFHPDGTGYLHLAEAAVQQLPQPAAP